MSQYWNPMVPELLVLDFNVSLEFYTTILGFTVINQREKPPFVYLEQGKVQLMLEQVHDDAWLTGDLIKPLGRGINFQIELSNLSELVIRLKSNRVSLFKELTETWYDTGDSLSGQRELLVQDPDGYLLRFIEYVGEKSKVAE